MPVCYLTLPLTMAIRSGVTRIVVQAVLPAVCRRAVPLRAVLADASCRCFSYDGDARGQHQEGAREQDREAKSRTRRLSLATGSAVAALGASYILYNNHFKLKAQGEVRGGGGRADELTNEFYSKVNGGNSVLNVSSSTLCKLTTRKPTGAKLDLVAHLPV